MSEKILKKRLRDENNNPYGMVVALNKNQLGYSICHSKLDKYNDDTAFKIAVSRAKSHQETNVDFWVNTKKYLKNFLLSKGRELVAFKELILMEERAKRYFKD